MEDLLERLEYQIRMLTTQYSHVKHINKQLYEGHCVLTKENKYLHMRQQQALAHIQSIILKLRNLG